MCALCASRLSIQSEWRIQTHTPLVVPAAAVVVKRRSSSSSTVVVEGEEGEVVEEAVVEGEVAAVEEGKVAAVVEGAAVVVVVVGVEGENTRHGTPRRDSAVIVEHAETDVKDTNLHFDTKKDDTPTHEG